MKTAGLSLSPTNYTRLSLSYNYTISKSKEKEASLTHTVFATQPGNGVRTSLQGCASGQTSTFSGCVFLSNPIYLSDPLFLHP